MQEDGCDRKGPPASTSHWLGLSLTTLLYCCGGREVMRPAVALSPPGPIEAEVAQPPVPCIVRGNGSSVMDRDVTIFADEPTEIPLVVVRENCGVQLTWWIDPARQGPIELETSGQRTLRVHGWAPPPRFDLYFRRDTALVEGHVFGRKGSTVGAASRRESDRLWVAQGTTLSEPKEVEGLVECRALRWGWVSRDGAMGTSGTARLVPNKHLELFSTPDGAHALDVTFASVQEVYESAQDGDWSKVSFDAGPLFVGWVKQSSLGGAPPSHHPLGSGEHAKAPRVRFMPKPTRLATVAEDTPLLVGKGTDLREAGIVERGANVRVGAVDGASSAFTFDHGYVIAPEGVEFFIATKALDNIREEDRGGSWTPPELPKVDEEAECCGGSLP